MCSREARIAAMLCRSRWSRSSTTSPSTERGTLAETAQRRGSADAAAVLCPAQCRSWLRQDPAPLTPLRRAGTGPVRRRVPHPARDGRHDRDIVRPPAAACSHGGDGDGDSLKQTAACERLRLRTARADPRRSAARLDRSGSKSVAGERNSSKTLGRAMSLTHSAAWPTATAGSARRHSQPGRWPSSPWRPGAGSRWTQGAGVVKALHPFCKLGGRHRTFLEVHLAKSRRIGESCGTPLPHVVTTSYLTHASGRPLICPTRENYGYPGPLRLSAGSAVGLRLMPMVRDLRFAWEEMPQQLLDEQAQKVRESLRSRADRMGTLGRRRKRLYRQFAAAMSASGRPLVRGAQSAAQRHPALAAGGAAGAALSDGPQRRYAGSGCRCGAAGIAYRTAGAA